MAKHDAAGGARQTKMRTTRRDWRRPTRRAASEPATVETLEKRRLLMGFSAEEVYLLELVNRARQDPLAEGARLGIDLTAGLSAGEIANLVAQEPLALNMALTVAMRAHALDMAERGYFDHYSPEGTSPTDRVQSAGYAGVAGENIAAGYSTIDGAHWGWLDSIGHRRNVLSLHTNFNASFHYDEIGLAVEFTNFGPYYRFYGQAFGVPTVPKTYILGVLYNDANDNDFYTIGEGRADVRVDILSAADPTQVVSTYTTDAAGNYQIEVDSGQYVVRFTDETTGRVSAQLVTVNNHNVKVDGQTEDFLAAEVADFPDFVGAATIPWADYATGVAAATSEIDFISDTDVWRITAAGSGLGVAIIAGSNGLDANFEVYDQNASLIGQGVSNGTGATLNFNVTSGQTYYIVVLADDGTSTGNYGLGMQLPAPDGPPPPPDGDDDFDGSNDSTFGVVALGNDAIGLTATADDGTPFFFVLDEMGDWSGIDLSDVAGGSLDSDQVLTWTDDGDQRVAANTTTGLVLFEENSGSWTSRNLTTALGGRSLTDASVTTFTSPFGITYVAGLDNTGDLIFYRETGGTDGLGRDVWTTVNITDTQLTPNGVSMPDLSGGLISYVTRGARLNIAGIDANGEIHVFFRRPGLSAWKSLNFSDLWDAPDLAGGLGVHVRPFGGINIAGLNSAGQLITTYWVPGFARWETINITNEAGGPALRADTLTAYGNVWGGPNFAGLDLSGRAVVYWTLPAGAGWRSTDLTQVVPGSPIAATGLIASRDPGSSEISLFGVDAVGELFRYFWRPGEGWDYERVTTPGV